MKNNRLLRISVLAITLVAFGVYFAYNQEQFSRIGDLTFWQIALIVIGQSVVILSNILILMVLVSIVSKRLPFVESARITAYSSLINFFGFLQGGVGFRGIYLKRQYALPLKKYVGLTSLQYVVFFAIAGLLLGVGLWLSISSTELLLLIAGGIVAAVALLVLIKFIQPRLLRAIHSRLEGIVAFAHVRPVLAIAGLTLIQLAGSMLANAVELNAIGAQITLGGLLIYTGISQFAIIIAVTPGALGIREGILLLVQSQMDLSTSDIVLAATIDRIVYFVTLALFAPLAIGFKKRSKPTTANNE